MTTREYYDDLAPFYHLVYADWEGSMVRHGRAVRRILQAHFPGRPERTIRILDAAAGVGTQAISLAKLGYDVVARDLSTGAISRLRAEATDRGLEIDAATADMRGVAGAVQGPFDAVVALDNAVPHLLTDDDIRDAFLEFRRVLGEDGTVLVSVRDYEGVDRAPTSFHPHGEHEWEGTTYRAGQRWEWTDPDRYATTFVIEKRTDDRWVTVLETTATYYAIPIPRLLGLMREAGFDATRVEDTSFFQPVLAGSVAR